MTQRSIPASASLAGQRIPVLPLLALAAQIYGLFSIPLVTMIFLHDGGQFRLSSLSPAKYSKISGEERAILNAYISHQEFL